MEAKSHASRKVSAEKCRTSALRDVSRMLLVTSASVGLAGMIAGCAGSANRSRAGVSPESAQTAGVQAVDARARLAELAAKQVQSPDGGAKQVWRELPGLDAASMEDAQGADDGKRLVSLATLVAGAPARADVMQDRAIEPSDLVESQRLFVRGKSLLLEGETGQALQALETALRLDPASHELLCEVGEVQLRAGRRLQGVATLRKAATMGTLPARAAWLLGREEMRQGDAAAALALLLGAHRDVNASGSPVLAAAIDAELGRALLASGHLAAANESLARSLAAPVQQFAVTVDTRDFGEVMRDRPALTMLRGDIASRVGDDEGAIEAYTQAANMPGLDPATPFTKLLATHLRAGRSADAAIVLLRHIDTRRGVVDPSLEGAATLLAQRTEVASLLVDALTQAPDTQRPASVQHRLARLAAGAAGDDTTARAILQRTLTQSGMDVTTAATLLDTFPKGDVARRLAAVRTLVEQDPLASDAVAEALLESGRDVAATLSQAGEARDVASRLALSAAMRRLGRVRDAQLALQNISQSELPVNLQLGLAVSQAANAAAAGTPEIAANIANNLASGQSEAASAVEIRALVLCLVQAGRVSDARAALERLTGGSVPGVTVDDYLLAADLAVRENAVATVAPLLIKARTLDATDERVHEAFAALYSPTGPSPNEQLLGEAMRELRAAVPGSHLLRLIIAQDQAQRGLWRQAIPNLQALVNDRGQPTEALDSLIRVWERNGDETTRAEAEALVRARLTSRPESTPWTLALSRLLLRAERAQEADDLLARAAESLQSDILLRQREFVLREGLKQPEQADLMVKQRLALAPPTLANRLEAAQIAMRQGKSAEALRDLSEAASLAGTMQAAQARAVVSLVTSLKPETLHELTQRESEGLLVLMDAARHLQRFAPAADLTRVQLMAQARPMASPELFEACKSLAPVSEQIATLAIVRVADTLRKRGDHSAMIRFVGAILLASPQPDPLLAREWMIRTAVRGTVDDAMHLIANVNEMQLADVIVGQFSDNGTPEDLVAARAEVAYVLSNLATSVMRDTVAKACLEKCLELKPDHPWAANNLGYQLLEHGGDMQRIEELVAIAYSQLADQASVTDTLGWLRYKQGQLDDVTLPDGNVREGAVTLIERAVTMVEQMGEANAELFDHLGDALWQRNRGDDRTRAIEMWTQAEATLARDILERRNIEIPGLPRVVEMEAHRLRLQAKVETANTTGQPNVAAMSVPATFTPRPEPAPIDIDDIWERQRQMQE